MEPRKAAGLVLIRPDPSGNAQRARVVMGRRHPNSRFVPDSFVFPGGGLEPGDAELATPDALDPGVAAQLPGGLREAHAAAVAAVRETREETGLSLTHGGAEGGGPPALDALDYFARAITPPASPIRYDTVFFIADGNLARGSLTSNGELLDLDWYSLAAAARLPRIQVTACLLGLVLETVAAGRAVGPGMCPCPCHLQWRNGVWSRPRQEPRRPGGA